MKLQVTKETEHKFKRGYPLIQGEDLQQVPASLPADWLTLIDSKGQCLAEEYLGGQNEGIGWLLPQHGPINQSFFRQLFEISCKKRMSFGKDSLITTYRLSNGEGDGIGGLIIDRYADCTVFSWYNETPYQKKAELLTAFRTVCPDITGVYERIHFFTKDLSESQLLYGEQTPEPLLVTRNSVQFTTYLSEGLVTGIFLDRREVRGRLVDDFTVGKTVLNMFSYTGAFPVTAVVGGAVVTISVDLAKRSLSKATEQFEVSHLNLAPQEITVMDVFDYFKYASRKSLSYGMIILNLPSFARNKKKVFSIAKNYGELVKNSIDVLTDKEMLITSTNATDLSLAKYQKMVITTLQEKDVRYKITDTYQLPADLQVNPNFPEGNYLKVLFIEIEE